MRFQSISVNICCISFDWLEIQAKKRTNNMDRIDRQNKTILTVLQAIFLLVHGFFFLFYARCRAINFSRILSNNIS